jgi:hypothetical protein
VLSWGRCTAEVNTQLRRRISRAFVNGSIERQELCLLKLYAVSLHG